LKVLTAELTDMVSGSADLEGSNKTRTPSTVPDIQAGEYGGRYVNYGIREHAMAACMNGMALHGGILPYAGTFLVFADYCRPSIRLSALMGAKVIYVMTHDSIGVGEDGPTHQPVEHVASLRAIPNLYTFRPADAMETAECWEISEIVLLASGSEVHLAVEAHTELAAQGVSARVVSVPCLDLFLDQDEKYVRSVIGKDLPKIAIEAGIRQGWSPLLNREDGFVGMSDFGASDCPF